MLDKANLTPLANNPSLPKRQVDEALISDIARQIAEAFNPRRIMLFGSRARGDNRPDSDIDIFVEMETTDSRFERYRKISRLFLRRWWSMDLVVYTPEEVTERQNSLCSIVPDIVKEGRVLYSRDA